MPSLQTVLDKHTDLCNEARELIARKGADYNRKQQAEGDTLFNLRTACILGVVDSPVKSVLVRLCDKLMRLISLADAEPQVTDESISDTIRDVINYAVYIAVFREEQAQHTRTTHALEISKPGEPTQRTARDTDIKADDDLPFERIELVEYPPRNPVPEPKVHPIVRERLRQRVERNMFEQLQPVTSPTQFLREGTEL